RCLLFALPSTQTLRGIGHWSLVTGHWSLVISKEVEAEKGRRETVSTTKINRSNYHYGIKNITGWVANGH
ncbi:MAG TPA: hypothetical protein P5268_10360, partial [Candidatus Marinimicrobia bacterium]|nr:hypothetical protein [Candidatus Neomarinimicrobiota bacterium]